MLTSCSECPTLFVDAETVSIPGLLTWSTACPDDSGDFREARVQLQFVGKTLPVFVSSAVWWWEPQRPGSAQEWLCVAGQGRHCRRSGRDPPPTPQPCAPSVSMVLLSDDPKGCEHGVLTSQSSPSQSPWCQVSQLDGSPEAPCHHFLFFQETTCPLAGFVQPHCRWWIWRMIKIVAGWLLNRDYINTMLTFQDWQAFCREEGHLFPSPMHITEPSYLLSTYWGLETMKMCFTSESLWRVSLSRNLISGWLSCSKEYNMRNLSILNDLKCKLNKKT